MIVIGNFSINYERFIEKQQSVTVKTFFFDNNYNEDGDGKGFSLQTQYNFYFSEKKQNAGFFVSPFLKFMKDKERRYNYNYNYNNQDKYYMANINALIAGFGIGYKWLWKKKLSFSLNTDIGRVLNESNYYSNADSYVHGRIGANMGIRF